MAKIIEPIETIEAPNEQQKSPKNSKKSPKKPTKDVVENTPPEEGVTESGDPHVTQESGETVVTSTTEVKTDAPTDKNQEMIPESISRILKIYNNEAELYICKAGGVFTSTTPKCMRGDAKLYQNPYYNGNE
ncbi:MAG: hypothetical protein ACRDD8_05945 [Bacteroidales bacterium]